MKIYEVKLSVIVEACDESEALDKVIEFPVGNLTVHSVTESQKENLE